MIKAVATALVLIAGAAVVLWFGNTLNSLVLGGLIGGLAALLLSIPISLMLFSYLSRRHDEQLRAEAELSQMELPARAMRGAYEVEEYAEGEEEEYWDEDDEEEYYQPPRQQTRNLPLPAPQRLPEQLSSPNRSPAPRRGTYGPLPRPGTKNMPATRGNADSRRVTTRHMNHPGLPGYEADALLRQQRSAALRAARMEKRQQYEDDVEVLPTHFSRPIPSMRPGQDLTDRYEQLQRPRSLRQLPPETPQPQRRSRLIEARPSRHDLSRSLPPEDDSSPYESAYLGDPETESLDDDDYPETGPMQRSTGQFARNPRPGSAFQQTENPSGPLGRPLVRRAPYMYEDDPIRQELSQQLHPPRIRRTSRLEQQPDQD